MPTSPTSKTRIDTLKGRILETWILAIQHQWPASATEKRLDDLVWKSTWFAGASIREQFRIKGYAEACEAMSRCITSLNPNALSPGNNRRELSDLYRSIVQ